MPRKTTMVRSEMRRWCDASMRPRPDAAENWLASVHALRLAPASMRPRPDAAENVVVVGLDVEGCLPLQ